MGAASLPSGCGRRAFEVIRGETRILGIDPGERRIGVAVSDELGLIARPVEVLHRRSLKRDIQRIVELATKLSVSRIIVGWPVSLNGDRGSAAQSAETFADKVREQVQQPVELWDERFTTVEARRYQSRRDQRRRAPVDAQAAAVMLQEYLDAHR